MNHQQLSGAAGTQISFLFSQQSASGSGREATAWFLLHDQRDSHADGDKLVDGNSVGEALRSEGNRLAVVRAGHVTSRHKHLSGAFTYPHSSLRQYLLSISCWFSLIMNDWMLVFVPEGRHINNASLEQPGNSRQSSDCVCVCVYSHFLL